MKELFVLCRKIPIEIKLFAMATAYYKIMIKEMDYAIKYILIK